MVAWVIARPELCLRSVDMLSVVIPFLYKVCRCTIQHLRGFLTVLGISKDIARWLESWVVVPSVVLTKRKWEIVKELESVYEEVVREPVTYGFKNDVKSFIRLKKCMYHELRRKYPQLPSHYIHTACQDASTRIKSFLKLKRKSWRNRTSRWLIRPLFG